MTELVTEKEWEMLLILDVMRHVRESEAVRDVMLERDTINGESMITRERRNH